MKHNTEAHIPQPVPALALVSATAPTIAVRSRSTVLAPARLEGHARAALLWSDALEAGGVGVMADHLGLERSTISRYATGERALPLGDVLAAPPRIAAVVLRHSLDWVEGAVVRPVTLGEALDALAGSLQLVTYIRTSPTETWTDKLRAEVAELAERTALRLWEMASALRKRMGAGR